MKPVAAAVEPAITDLDTLFSFAVWMHGSRESAAARMLAAADAAPDDVQGWLALLWRGESTPRRGGSAERRLLGLEGVLRGEMSVPVAPDHPLVRGDPRRLRVLESEVQRACLGAVIVALPAMPRAVFLMASLFRLSLAQIAAITGASSVHVQAAYRTAVRTLEDYLGIRCQHLDPRNVCSCAGRVGVALARGFIRWPDHHEHDAAPRDPAGQPRLLALYASLPRFRMDARPAAALAVRGAARRPAS